MSKDLTTFQKLSNLGLRIIIYALLPKTNHEK